MSRSLVTLWNARITSEPKPDWADNGSRKLSFSCMVTSAGNEGDRVHFYRCAVYGQHADYLIANGYARRGAAMNVEGRIEAIRPWQDKQGEWRASADVTVWEIEPCQHWTPKEET